MVRETKDYKRLKGPLLPVVIPNFPHVSRPHRAPAARVEILALSKNKLKGLVISNAQLFFDEETINTSSLDLPLLLEGG